MGIDAVIDFLQFSMEFIYFTGNDENREFYVIPCISCAIMLFVAREWEHKLNLRIYIGWRGASGPQNEEFLKIPLKYSILEDFTKTVQFSLNHIKSPPFYVIYAKYELRGGPG